MADAKNSGARGVDRTLVAIEALIGITVVGALVGQSYGPAPTVVFLVCAVGLAFSGYSIVRMFQALRDPTLDVMGRVEDEERQKLEQEKYIILQGIKELEADAAVGKVDAADYEHLRSTAEARALGIIQKIKLSDARWMSEAESLVEKRLGAAFTGPRAADEKVGGEGDTTSWAGESKSVRKARFALASLFDHRPTTRDQSNGVPACAACHHPADHDARFCSGCGRPFTVAAPASEARA